jgi:flavin-dependent dehydrogenase
MWWIPFANSMDSVGCVLHARVAKERSGSVTELFEATIASAPRLMQGLVGAERVTPVHTAANFSYRVSPAVGDRYIAIGDALGFVDPVFSTGVFFAMRSAELAAEVILPAFAQQDFRAPRFQPYEKRMRQGMAPFLTFIRRFYDPALLDMLCAARRPRAISRCVMWVLSGAAFETRPLWMRAGLLLFFAIAASRKMLRWVTGQPVRSRWHW